MKYTIYEDPTTRQFAHLPLPRCYVDGDTLPSVSADRWFDSHADAIAALADLLNRDEHDVACAPDPPPPALLASTIAFPARWPIPWPRQ